MHTEEEALGTRLVMDTLSCLIEKEADPSKLIAMSPGVWGWGGGWAAAGALWVLQPAPATAAPRYDRLPGCRAVLTPPYPTSAPQASSCAAWSRPASTWRRARRTPRWRS
jgi:hypothetical protein